MRVLYVTWGEVPRLSSVYGGQVVEVVAALQRHPRIEHASLLAGYPLIHSGMVREKWNYGKQLAAICDKIGTSNFVTRRLPVPPVGVYPKPWQIPFFTLGQHEFLARRIRAVRADVVQCRSYLATHFVLEARKRSGMDFKVVFDARSLMPDEAVISGRWSRDHAAYRFWKNRERELLQQADLSTAVSKPMQDFQNAMGAKRTALIYLNVAVDGIEEARVANVSRLAAGRPIMAYCGYLAEGSWHSPSNLWRAFAAFHAHCPGARLMVITKSNHEMLRESVRSLGMAGLLDAITFTSAPSPRATIGLLQDADLSVLSYRDPEGEFEKLLAEAVFATKSAEYLSVGLPLLVNRYCGGARDYVLSHSAGVVYDPVKPISAIDAERLLILARDRLRISRDSRDDFSLDRNAERLVQYYIEIMGDEW